MFRTREPGQPRGESLLPTCVVCRCQTILDDVVLTGDGHACICLRCHERQHGSALPIAKSLRKAITAAMG